MGELLSHKNEIEHLQLLLAKLRRMMFGRSSAKIRQQVEQLELSRQRSRVRTPSSPPLIPKILESIGNLQ